ncbi:hypothetical protein [Marinitenerispora sediminis]|uniref:Uncharacterized protein n=1 Tax=Marinitenerispora sediminis TaxID=1931232 RepID=A0A368SZY1_9ACTN|nr:hypothetical protein [Marinitenerispora sediminis]RCV49127.1 hypothetical protein DEF28_21755 [Marinitenerispora sediminis]RCV51879.1 hypothetical protein DEF24_22700 [Marinitenerispora sediminis]RCV57238.1 hypothetical protein DEF23_11140 [Marinitenerispora sediminis]
MIIWRGWGILVLLISAVLGGPGTFAAEVLLGPDLMNFGTAGGLALAGIAVFFIGQRLNRPRPGYHPATGQPVMFGNSHTFFFVPMQYWGFILLGISLVTTVVTLVGQL